MYKYIGKIQNTIHSLISWDFQLEQSRCEITRAGEGQTQEAGDRICSGRSQGSRQEEADSCDLRVDLQEACRGSQREDLLGIHTVDVPVEEGEDDSS